MRELAQRIVDATAMGDETGIVALYADEAESTEVGMPPISGIEGLREKLANWQKTVTGATWRARNVWIGGNTIIIEWNARVTLSASGKTVDFSEIAVHEIENGRIARERFYYDRSALQG
jgi:ketosteroid isomerase-like protein